MIHKIKKKNHLELISLLQQYDNVHGFIELIN